MWTAGLPAAFCGWKLEATKRVGGNPPADQVQVITWLLPPGRDHFIFDLKFLTSCWGGQHCPLLFSFPYLHSSAHRTHVKLPCPCETSAPAGFVSHFIMCHCEGAQRPWQSVSSAPLPKGGWHGEAVTGGFLSPRTSVTLRRGDPCGRPPIAPHVTLRRGGVLPRPPVLCRTPGRAHGPCPTKIPVGWHPRVPPHPLAPCHCEASSQTGCGNPSPPSSKTSSLFTLHPLFPHFSPHFLFPLAKVTQNLYNGQECYCH